MLVSVAATSSWPNPKLAIFRDPNEEILVPMVDLANMSD